MRRLTLIAAALALFTGTAAAQSDYPTRPITVIVPFTAGGPTDTVARLVAEPMTRALGQQVIVENVGGAGGTLGAAPRRDRPTPTATRCCCTTSARPPAPRSTASCSYDPAEDFAGIGLVTDVPMTIVARPDFPANSIAELIEYDQGEQGRRHPRQCRRRLRLASVRHAASIGARRADDDRALQGHRPGDDRPSRRPGRHHVRPDHQHDRPDQDRQGQGLCRDHARAPADPARTCRPWTRLASRASRWSSGTASTPPRARPSR